MPDYTSHADTLAALTRAQDADQDMRDQAREAHHFVDKRDGQWEPFWWEANEKQPRYTFDQVGPQIDEIAGEMERADFNVTIRPAGGDATKDDAKTLDGLVRNIEQISKAKDIFNLAGRNMVTAGIDGWRLEHKFVDDDSFDQDLIISPVANWIDSAFLGPHKEPDGSDAPYGFLLEALAKEEYDERWPEGSGASVSNTRIANAYYHKPDVVIVGQFYFIKSVPRDLLLMTSGRVLEDNDTNRPILDELEAAGEQVVKRRTRDKHIVYSRLFDGTDWLGEAQRTVFSTVPLIPAYANFKITEDKIIYRGHVEKLMDPQRVFNYSKSREVGEGALAPRGKYWGTKEQTAGHEATIATLNTNMDPFQHYNADPKVNGGGPPTWVPGGSINPGLNTTSSDMLGIIQRSGNQYDASMGASPNNQSGVAVKRLQNKSDVQSIKYFSAMERAICRTGRMIVDAIPTVYDTTRQARILKEDGSFEMATLNQQVRDEQTARMVTVNDVSKGTYDVTCSAGEAFQNRQEETVTNLIEMSANDPTVLDMAGDIIYNNLNSPGMDLVAARKRKQLFEAGMIPDDQLNDEERALKEQAALDAQNNPPPEDPAMVLARAETGKAEAEQAMVQVRMMAIQRQEDRKDWEAERKDAAQRFEQMMKLQTSMIDQVNTQADSLKKLADAMGIEILPTPGALVAIQGQTGAVIDAQAEVKQ